MQEFSLAGHRCLSVAGSLDKNIAVVLLHGYGANANDLFPLHSLLDPNRQLHWYFPEGGKDVMFGSEPIGKAWFDIDVAGLQMGLMRREFDQVAMGLAERLRPALGTVGLLLEPLLKKHSQIILGGFSQGAILAASHLPKMSRHQVAGALLFSPSFAANWDEAYFKDCAPSVFVSHGTHDPILPIPLTEKLVETLRRAGVNVSWVSFPGGHEIPPDALGAARQYLTGVVLQ